MSDEYKFHPVSNILPLLPASELAELAEDIKANGLTVPIVLCDDQILDGRNRWLACRSVDVEPQFTVYEGDQPLQYALSLNLRRRNLTTGQKAAIAAELANMRREDTLIQNRSSDTQKCTTIRISQSAAADMIGVSLRYVSEAAAIRRADSVLFLQLHAGKVTMAQAISRAHPQKSKSQAALVGSMKSPKAVAKGKEPEAEPPTVKRPLAECEQVISDAFQEADNAATDSSGDSDKPDRAETVVRVDHHPHWPRGPGTIRGETEQLLEELVKRQVEKWGVPGQEINAYIRSWTMSVLNEETR